MVQLKRSIDTIYLSINESFRLDTIEHSKKYGHYIYRISTSKNKELFFKELKKHFTFKEKSDRYQGEYSNGEVFDVPYKELGLFNDDDCMRIVVKLTDKQKLSDILGKINSLLEVSSVKESEDTVTFDLHELDNYDGDWDENGKYYLKYFPDDELQYPLKEMGWDIEKFRLCDNYLPMVHILTQSTLELGNIQQLFLFIDQTGKVSKSYYLKPEDTFSYPVDVSNFSGLSFPVLEINGKVRPYKLYMWEDYFHKPLKYRFLRDLAIRKNVYPIFDDQDSLYIYKSETDHRLYTYGTNKKREYFYKSFNSFPDTLPLNKIFYDFNRDSLIDMVYPNGGMFNEIKIVLYQNKFRDRNKSQQPARYYGLKFSKDSTYFTTWKTMFFDHYEEHKLYTFKPYGDSLILGYEILVYHLFGMDKNNMDSLLVTNKKWHGEARMFHFTNVFNEKQKDYYITSANKAQKEIKKMDKLIVYYRKNPEKMLNTR